MVILPPEPLMVTMIDSNYNLVEEPEVAFTEVPYSHDCRQIITQLTTDDQQIYVTNYDTSSGWTVTISANDPTSTWSNGEYGFDFNDPSGDGCVDGDDPDTLAGSMEIYTESALLDSWLCLNCSTDSVHRVPAWVFDEQGWVNSVTLLYATIDADHRGDWLMSDIMVHQTIPASQPAIGDYEIPLLLSITAN